jgi:hypothetical protein
MGNHNGGGYSFQSRATRHSGRPPPQVALRLLSRSCFNGSVTRSAPAYAFLALLAVGACKGRPTTQETSAYVATTEVAWRHDCDDTDLACRLSGSLPLPPRADAGLPKLSPDCKRIRYACMKTELEAGRNVFDCFAGGWVEVRLSVSASPHL